MYRIEEKDNGDLLVEEPSVDYVYTYADYIKWRFKERVELFKGHIAKMSAPSRHHQEISGNIFLFIRMFLQSKQCKVFAAPFDVRLPVQNKKKDNEIITVVQPDLSVVCDPSKLDEKGCCGAPDIVIEILSPGNTALELQNKFDLYEEAGVQEYWIVNTANSFIIRYTLTNGKYIGSKPFSPGQDITTPVLPGLQIDVTQIFQN